MPLESCESQTNRKEWNKRTTFLLPYTLQNNSLYPCHTTEILRQQTYCFYCKMVHPHKPEHINTYPQEPIRRIFSCARSSIPLLSSSFFVKREKWALSWQSGAWQDPLALIAEKIRSGLCDRETHTYTLETGNRSMHIKVARCDQSRVDFNFISFQLPHVVKRF